MAEVETNYDTHGFALAGEGDRLDQSLPVFPAKVLRKLKEGGLSLEPNGSGLFGVWIDVLEGSVILIAREPCPLRDSERA